MKNLIKYIITESKSTESWNEKFYTKKDGTTSIYIDGIEKDVTELYEATKQSDEYERGKIVDMYNELISPLIDLELDLVCKDITEKELVTKKYEYLNSL